MHPPTSRDVLAAVAAAFEVPPAALRSRSRTLEAVYARWAAALLLTELCGLSGVRAGRVLAKNHTLIIHARKRVGALGPAFWGRLEAARARLGERP